MDEPTDVTGTSETEQPVPPSEPAAPPEAPPEPAPASSVPPPSRPGAQEAPPRRRRGCGLLLLATVIALFAGGAGGYLAARFVPQAQTAPRGILVTGSTTREPVAAVAAVAVSSVVNIDVSGDASGTASSGLPEGHPDVPVSGQGSGVAYADAPGGGTYILTNEHVIAEATGIKVTASDGNRYKATVVGADAETDIAVIRVPGRVPLIEKGDSDKLVVGQLVVVIGSPFGLEHSVSSGVVSGLHRSLPTEYGDSETAGVYPLVDVIQTDAAINPGNSGGALLDRDGKLVGIASAIYSESGSSAGVGFAIPEKTALRIAQELLTSGKAKHPFLGILGETVDETLAKQKDLPATEGALVVEVTKGTNAESAGLEVDDLIVALDGKPIRSMDDLILAVRRTRVGQTVTLTLWRDGKRIELKMPVGDKPRD